MIMTQTHYHSALSLFSLSPTCTYFTHPLLVVNMSDSHPAQESTMADVPANMPDQQQNLSNVHDQLQMGLCAAITRCRGPSIDAETRKAASEAVCDLHDKVIKQRNRSSKGFAEICSSTTE
jgi:hypothetical protein